MSAVHGSILSEIQNLHLPSSACWSREQSDIAGSSLLLTPEPLPPFLLLLLICRALDSLITSPYSSPLGLGVSHEEPQLASWWLLTFGRLCTGYQPYSWPQLPSWQLKDLMSLSSWRVGWDSAGSFDPVWRMMEFTPKCGGGEQCICTCAASGHQGQPLLQQTGLVEWVKKRL